MGSMVAGFKDMQVGDAQTRWEFLKKHINNWNTELAILKVPDAYQDRIAIINQVYYQLVE